MTLPQRLRRAAECAGSAALAGLSEADRQVFLAAFDGHAAGRYSAINSLASTVWTEARDAGLAALRALAAPTPSTPAPAPPPAPKPKPAVWSNAWLALPAAERAADLAAAREQVIRLAEHVEDKPIKPMKPTSKTYGTGLDTMTVDWSQLDAPAPHEFILRKVGVQ